jgi:hypothetical protein
MLSTGPVQLVLDLSLLQHMQALLWAFINRCQESVQELGSPLFYLAEYVINIGLDSLYRGVYAGDQLIVLGTQARFILQLVQLLLKLRLLQ